MMQSEKLLTKSNAISMIKAFAKEYRKELGKAPGEIIIVGGGSILLNYNFRESTQDFDVILNAASGVNDIIHRFADDNGLPRDWMNTDFIKTRSYSNKLAEYSSHYLWLNNNTLEIRTVSGKYLIAMKLRSHRDYRNDISDVLGIIIEEVEADKPLSFAEVNEAYFNLYNENIESNILEIVENFFKLSLDELKNLFLSRKNDENIMANTVMNYIDDGMQINVRNVDEVIARLKKKMQE